MNIYLISDSTGDTLSMMINAVIVQFDGYMPKLHIHSLVRNQSDLMNILYQVDPADSQIFYTITNVELKKTLHKWVSEHSVNAMSVLDPIIDQIKKSTGLEVSSKVGAQYEINHDYFKRMAAIEFSMMQDDGASMNRLKDAEVIIFGVSRTSKTPTCVYLGYRKIKAANIPLAKGLEVPKILFDLKSLPNPPLIVGLTINPNRLLQIRQQRLETIGETERVEYADMKLIQEEVSNARLLFEQLDCPVIDITRRSIEETSAAIMSLMRKRDLT